MKLLDLVQLHEINCIVKYRIHFQISLKAWKYRVGCPGRERKNKVKIKTTKKSYKPLVVVTSQKGDALLLGLFPPKDPKKFTKA